jgi:hypothetical protein
MLIIGRLGEMTLRRWLAVSGVVAGVFALVSFLGGGGSPNDDASAAKVVSYYRDHQTGTKLLALVGAISAVLLVLFATRLRELLQGGPGGDGALLAAAAFGGAVILAAGIALSSATSFALARAADLHFAGPAQALNVLNNNAFFVLVVGVSSLLLATGIATVRRPALPRWLGWVAIVIGVLALAGPAGVFGAGLSILWLIVASLMMLVRKDLIASGAV